MTKKRSSEFYLELTSFWKLRYTIVVNFTIRGVIFCSFCIVGYVLIFATYKSHGFPKLQVQIRIWILRKCISLELNIQREVYYSTGGWSCHVYNWWGTFWTHVFHGGVEWLQYMLFLRDRCKTSTVQSRPGWVLKNYRRSKSRNFIDWRGS